MRVVLISTYEMGRQPFGLASPAAWLRRECHEVTCADLSREPLPRPELEKAELIAFFLPMHTATRLFLQVRGRVRALNPRAHLCGYGLYAPLNAAALREAGVETILGGEFEQGLVDLAGRLSRGLKPGCIGSPAEPVAASRSSDSTAGIPLISLDRQQFVIPERAGLPPLTSYAHLAIHGETRRAGYTEASRGCKHQCRHCPVVPVYQGMFRIVQREIVLADIRQQVAAGAQHITFGDPDFLNGPGHAVPIVESLHREWPELTYDVTVKVEHILNHRDLLPVLKRTGCAFVTSAVESLDDAILEKLAKGHTRAGFTEALRLMRAAELPLSPTFLPFTPWTTLSGYREFLRELVELGLAGQVACQVGPVQLAIRLLIPEGSLLLQLPEIQAIVEPFDAPGLCYPWRNADPAVDELCRSIHTAIQRADQRKAARGEVFREIWDLAEAGAWPDAPMQARVTIPYMTEPWYC